MNTPGTIRPLKTGGWIADLTVNGKRAQRRAPDKAAALALLRQLQSGQSGPAAGGLSLLQAQALSLRVRWGGLAWESGAVACARSIAAYFGEEARLSSIGAPEWQRFREHLLALGRTPATVNRHQSVLSAMQKDAMQHGQAQSLPRLQPKLREPVKRDRIITEEEVAALREALPTPAADLLSFLLATACRWGEAERLKGEDVDRSRQTVTFLSTKNGTNRTVPLTPRGWQSLCPHLPADPGQAVWPFSYHQYERLWSRAKDQTGLGEDDSLTIHCTRHTAASRMAQANVSLAQIQAFGGWRSLASVQRYLHVQTDQLAGCIAALAAAER